MTPQQRLHAAKTEIARLRPCTLPGGSDETILDLHHQVLDRVDDWLLSRLGRGGLLTDLVRGLLDIYAPEPTGPATTDTKEAHV